MPSLNTGNAILSNAIAVNSSYNVGIGGAASGGISLKNTKKLTGASTTFANYADGQIQTDATGLSHYFYSEANVIAATTATGIYHFKATQGTFGAGSSLTVQAGLVIDASLSGAGTNYGIISNINTADNNWNLYIGGTAKNWIASSLGIGSGTQTPTATLDVNGTLKASGAATFSSSVTINGGGNPDLDVKGTAIIRGNGSAYTTHYFTTAAANVAVYNQYNASGTLINRFSAGGDSYILGGNVGIGTSSPNTKLSIQNDGASVYSNSGWRNTSSTAELYIGVGGSSVSATFAQNNAYILNAGASALVFGTSDTERMRITSGGYLKASNTGTYTNVNAATNEFNNNAANWTLVNRNSNANPNGILIDYTTQPINAGNEYLYCTDNSISTLRASIRSNGGIANFQANNVNLSDERTKKDIIPLESYWDKFKAIEIVKFKYKDQTHDDFNIGVIAQQVEAVAPEFVDVDGWDNKPKLDEEGNEIMSNEEPLKSVYTADLHHATIKVLQECMAKIEKQQAQIEELTQKVENQQQTINSLINR